MRTARIAILTASLAALSVTALPGCGCGPTDDTQQSQPSCNVSQDAIKQSYSASYDDTTGNTTVSAIFAFGEQGLQLSGSSSVTFNGKAIPSSNNVFGHVTYSTSVTGQNASNQFVFTDCNGKTYTNTITMNAFAFTAPASASMSAGFTMAVTGPGAQSGETVDYNWVSSDGITGVGGALGTANGWVGSPSSISFPASTFACQPIAGTACFFKAGFTYALNFVRSASASLQQAGSAGGQISVSYKTKSQNVALTQ